MTNEQVRMIAGSVLIAGGAIGYSISRASPSAGDNATVSFLVLILGVPLLFPGILGTLKSQVQALTKKK